LRVKPSKCEFFKSSVTYLGHGVSANGIATDLNKLSAVQDWPVPINIKTFRQFLGFIGYYHKYVPNYAQIVQPLNELLQGHGDNKGSNGSKKKAKTLVKWVWGGTQQKAFEIIIRENTHHYRPFCNKVIKTHHWYNYCMVLY
jgi:hypothetical protein